MPICACNAWMAADCPTRRAVGGATGAELMGGHSLSPVPTWEPAPLSLRGIRTARVLRDHADVAAREIKGATPS